MVPGDRLKVGTDDGAVSLQLKGNIQKSAFPALNPGTNP